MFVFCLIVFKCFGSIVNWLMFGIVLIVMFCFGVIVVISYCEVS